MQRLILGFLVGFILAGCNDVVTEGEVVYDPPILTGKQKALLFDHIYNDIGKLYTGDSAAMIFDYAATVLDNEESLAFEKGTSLQDMYRGRGCVYYRNRSLLDPYTGGDLVFVLNGGSVQYAGFIRSYDPSSGILYYLTVRDGRIKEVSNYVNRYDTGYKLAVRQIGLLRSKKSEEAGVLSRP